LFTKGSKSVTPSKSNSDVMEVSIHKADNFRHGSLTTYLIFKKSIFLIIFNTCLHSAESILACSPIGKVPRWSRITNYLRLKNGRRS
jgi:hypothetical protein